jgi:integrase/recombinase XerD
MPLSAATVARRLAVMSSLGEDIADALDVTNPWQRVTRPKVPRTGTTPALRLLDLVSLLEGARAIACRWPADAAAVLLMTLVALRVGELCALTVGAIQQDGDHTVVLVTRKGGDRMSREPITPKVNEILIPLTMGRAASDLLLLREDGRPFDRWRAQTALNRAGRHGGLSKAAIARLTPHVGRATAATLLRGQGLPIDKVQELLGHASPLTTQRYDRGGALMDGHAGYDLATLTGWGV